jgi:hypothetical protein
MTYQEHLQVGPLLCSWPVRDVLMRNLSKTACSFGQSLAAWSNIPANTNLWVIVGEWTTSPVSMIISAPVRPWMSHVMMHSPLRV